MKQQSIVERRRKLLEEILATFETVDIPPLPRIGEISHRDRWPKP